MSAAVRRRRRFVSSATVITALTLAGCGVATGDDTYSPIPSDEIPLGLNATSTTTSTTTTTTTLVDPTATASSTTTPVRLEAIDVYFLSRGRLQPVPIELPAGFSADQVTDKLEEGPLPDVALDTLIEEGLIVSTSEAGGVLTVDLDPDTYNRIPSTQQTEAIAQIVLTMINSLDLVGQVVFTLDGEPIPVKKGDSLLSDVGEPLSFDDYEILLVRAPLSATTTTATTEPPPATAGP